MVFQAGEMIGYQSAHHDQLDHARVRRDVQNTESKSSSEEFHIQPTLLLGLALTTSISFNLFLIFYIYRKSLFVSLPQDIKAGHTTIENVEILLTSTQNTCHRKISQRKISQKSDLKFIQEIK